MLSKTPFRIAGAAMLGTVALLGTNAANAQIDLDAADKTNPAMTYAKETLVDAVDNADYSMYYTVAHPKNSISGKIGLGGETDNSLLITFTLDGMVFTGDAALAITSTDNAVKDASIATGGEKGDISVVFTAKRGDTKNGKDGNIQLSVGTLGIMADGSGSITMHVVDRELQEILRTVVDNPGEHSVTYSGAVAVASGVKETATTNNLTAIVSDKFMSFGTAGGVAASPRTLMGTLGSFAVAVAPDRLDAAGGEAVADLMDLFNDNADAEKGSTFSVSGNLGFAKAVWLDDDTSCDDTPADIRKMKDDGKGGMMVDSAATESAAQAIGDGVAKHLCITLYDPDDEMEKDKAVAVPAGGYTVATSYVAATDAEFAPSDSTNSLGMIERDGTTVHLPYLTTDERYNQRIVIVNRGGEAAYSMSFTAEDGITADAGMEAEGVLAANSTTVFRTSDVVSISDGPPHRAAGTLIVEAQMGTIDVATNQTNRATGGTDTVVY